MKKLLVITGIILLITLPLVLSQSDAIRWDLLANAFKRLQERVNLLESNTAQQAHVYHNVMRDLGNDCVFNEEVGNVGWCPDGTTTLFVIPEPNFQLGSTVDVNVATQFINDGPKIIKRAICDVNAVTYDSQGIPYLRISCPQNTVIEGTLLAYTIVN